MVKIQVCSGSASDQTLIFVQFFAQVANIVKVGTLLGLANVFKLFKKIIFNVPCLNTFHWVQVNGQQIMT